jgi:GNAT superfamily N-acetyltransferase
MGATADIVDIQSDAWLSRVMGYPVFRVACESANGHARRARILQHVAPHDRAMYFARVPTLEVALARDLAAAGFYVVDVNVTLARPASAPGESERSQPSPDVHVGEIAASERAAVLDMARDSFRYSRFHLDPLLTRDDADRIKREWIVSYLDRQRGDRLFVATVAGRPAGFLAALASNAENMERRVIDLMAVSPEFRRQGVGEALIQGFLSAYRDRCARFEVATQAANIPSLRLYEKLGFSVSTTAYVLHMHARNGAPAAG